MSSIETPRRICRSTSPHFSHPLYCIGAMIRPDCVALRRPPQRTVQYVCGGLSRALSASLDRWACARWREFGLYSRREEGAYQGIGNRRATQKTGQIPPALRVAAAPACRRCCSSVTDSRSTPSSRLAARAGGARDEYTPLYQTRYYHRGVCGTSSRRLHLRNEENLCIIRARKLLADARSGETRRLCSAWRIRKIQVSGLEF